MYKKLLEEGTFKIPAYDPETHSYPMTWSDLVIMVEDINEDKRKGKQRRLSDLKRHWQISVNKELAGLLFWLFFTTFIQSNKILKPGYLYVKDIVRPTYAIKDGTEAIENGNRIVVTAPLPLMPIYKGMPGASILAEILLQKYEYHVPFYRQVKQLEPLGVKLSRNTLDGWFKPVCELLRPLYLELKKKVLSSDYIQVDETTLPVIEHDRHKAAKEHIWIVRAAVPRLFFFDYDNGSRSQKVAVDLLKSVSNS